jgi:hypothetical protein
MKRQSRVYYSQLRMKTNQNIEVGCESGFNMMVSD